MRRGPEHYGATNQEERIKRILKNIPDVEIGRILAMLRSLYPIH